MHVVENNEWCRFGDMTKIIYEEYYDDDRESSSAPCTSSKVIKDGDSVEWGAAASSQLGSPTAGSTLRIVTMTMMEMILMLNVRMITYSDWGCMEEVKINNISSDLQYFWCPVSPRVLMSGLRKTLCKPTYTVKATAFSPWIWVQPLRTNAQICRQRWKCISHYVLGFPLCSSSRFPLCLSLV